MRIIVYSFNHNAGVMVSMFALSADYCDPLKGGVTLRRKQKEMFKWTESVLRDQVIVV